MYKCHHLIYLKHLIFIKNNFIFKTWSCFEGGVSLYSSYTCTECVCFHVCQCVEVCLWCVCMSVSVCVGVCVCMFASVSGCVCMRKNAPYTFVPDIIFFTKRIIKIRHHIDNLGQNMFQFIKSYTNEFFLTSIESLYSILSLKTRNIFF